MKKLNALDVISTIFGLLLFTIGVLNFLLVNILTGCIYVLISLLFLPSIDTFLKNTFNFSIPFWLKVVMFFLIMWPTLGVGDLAEIMGL